MKVTRKLLREYVKKILSEAIVLPQTVQIQGKNFLIVNSLIHMEQLTELLTQAQAGGSAGFGNYFEDVVIESFRNQYEQLNDGGGGPFPFADVYKEVLDGLGFYSVKIRRILDDSSIGGGDIKPHQLRSMLQHETTVNSYKNINIYPGLISGALEPSFFAEASKLGLPIKIQIVNPTSETPAFRYEDDPNATLKPQNNRGILCVRAKTEEYAKRVLGSGIDQPGYLYPTIQKDSDGFYRINGSENIFKENPNHSNIINDPTAVTMMSLLQPALSSNGFTSIKEFELWKKNKSKKKRQIPTDQEDLIDVYLKAYKGATARAKKALEDPFKPNKTAVGTYELFNQRIMENTGKFEDPVYLIVTGGFAKFKDILDVLNGVKQPLPNIKSLIERVQQVLDFQVEDLRDKGKPIATRLINAFSRQELISKTAEMDEENFPNGFFIEIQPGNKLGYFDPEDVDFPFQEIGSKALLDKVRKYAEALKNNPSTKRIPDFDRILQGLAAGYSLPSVMPKQPKINKDLANKVLIRIAVNEFLGQINSLQIPFPNPNSQAVQDFKKALKEFNLLKKISDDSRSSSILTELDCSSIDENIDNYREKVVLPLARKVLPKSMISDGRRITKNQIIKRLGILSEVFSPVDVNLDIEEVPLPDFDKYLDQQDLAVDPDEKGAANIETVLSLLFNMEDLLIMIMEIGKRSPIEATNALKSSFINEMKRNAVYQKILLELLKT